MQTTKGRQSKILLEGQTRCGDTVDIMLTGKEAQETWKMNKHMKSKGETQAMWLLNKWNGNGGKTDKDRKWKVKHDMTLTLI